MRVDLTTEIRMSWESDWYECPACGWDAVESSFRYCPHCGGWIDWEEEEES